MRNWKCIKDFKMNGGDIAFTKGKIYVETSVTHFGKEHTGEPWTDISLIDDQEHNHGMDWDHDMPEYFEYIIEEEIEAMAQLALKLSQQLTHNRPRSRLYDIRRRIDIAIGRRLSEMTSGTD